MKNYLFIMPKEAAKSSGGYNVFPIGIAYVTAYLKQFNINVFTSNFEFEEGTTQEILNNLINQHNIDVVCVSGLSRDYDSVKEIIDITRQINLNILTVVGGGIISGDPLPAMEALEADIGVVGQGEITMYELAKALDNNVELNSVAGLIYLDKDNKYIQTEVRADIKDMDSIPFPDYDGFAFNQYMKSIDYEVAYVIASRSCPYKCTFCFHPSGNKYRQRSLDNLFKEIDYLLTSFPVKRLCISDELFAPSREHVIEFCNKIKPYNIDWDVQLRVRDVDKELLNIMKDSGCITISYGIESADESVLKSMRKKIKLSEIDNALRLTHEANIEIQGGLIFGDVAESKETIENSLSWYDKYPQYGLELNMINIFPGTALYNYATHYGVIKDKIDFLKKGCPLINVSKLTNKEYDDLASNIYVRNMKAKYLPTKYNIVNIKADNACDIEMQCNKCSNKQIFKSDMLHIVRISCSACKQRYYVDPFLKIDKRIEYVNNLFISDENIVLWGAGEICIKLIENYDIFNKDNIKVVDISKSRQGKDICGKKIFSPDIINTMKISKVIITVVNRKDEILNEMKKYKSVTSTYLPYVDKDLVFDLYKY